MSKLPELANQLDDDALKSLVGALDNIESLDYDAQLSAYKTTLNSLEAQLESTN